MAISANLILLLSFGGLVYTSFTKVEDIYCKSRYDAYYRDLDEAKSACDADARCFGINDQRCDGIKEDGSINTSGNWFRKCFHEKNDEKHVSNINTCVYVKDDNRHCQCLNSYPEGLKNLKVDGEPVGNSCTNQFSENGEPWCWIKSSIRHTCTDAKRDNSQNQIPKTSGWYYSTRPCASPVVGGSGWANGYKCPTGSGDTVFHGDLGYDLEEAKEICAAACEDDYHCKFGQLYFNFGQLDNQKCILKGNDCGLNWWSNRRSTHYVYQKDMPVCHCENKDGIMPNNGIMCGYIGGEFTRYAHCASNERCNGATGDDNPTSWVCDYRKGDLCEMIDEF